MLAANSHQTAIHRQGASAPCRWLDKQERLLGPVLDWGCGYGQDVEYIRNAFGYDPYHQPKLPPDGELYNTVLCIYVVNTIPEYYDRCRIIGNAYDYLADYGWLYVAIRCDHANLNGWTKKDTWQGYVGQQLLVGEFTLLHKTGHMEIYGWQKVPH